LKYYNPDQDQPSTRHPLRPSAVHVFVLLLILMAIVFFALVEVNRTSYAQTPRSTATYTPTTTALPLAQSTGTVALIPETETLNTDSFKALVRSRIVMLLRAKMLASTPEASATPTVSHIVTIPLVMNSVLPTPAVMAEAVPTPTPTPTAIPLSTATPAPPLALLTEPTPDGALRTVQVPIPMYHYLSVPPDGADRYRRDLSVAPDLFAQHLDRLLEEGYTTIRLDDLLAHLTGGSPLPARPVILTFDDGYRDNYTNAFPLLKERGMTATFFIITDLIDANLPDYLSWDMVREMHAGGMSIQSHGRNHASLKGRDDDYLIWQALGSLETIEYELGVRPRFISYPAGQYDENTIRIFQSAHYWAGVTTVQGATHNSEELFQLQRVRIRGTTSADDLIRLLKLDW
jgi:peptidoglycan/xylan/chitin deacetylase (PgdA/CDA1 family)